MIPRSIESINIEGEDFFSFPIDTAIEHSPKIATGFFVPLGPKKKVRIEVEGNVAGKLKGYREKGLKNILLARSDYDRFLKRAKTGLTIFFFQELGDRNKTLNEVEIFKILRNCINYLGMSSEICKICEPIIKQTISFLRASGQLGPLYKLYNKNCQEQFVFHIFRSYMSIALAKALNWPPHLYEKFAQVNLICDLQLTMEDYESYYMNLDDPSKWTEAYREHPKMMVSLLERHHTHNIGREVIKGIDQHEEHPNGRGFPYGMSAASFDQMTAIILTSKLLTKKLLESEFSYQDRKAFIDDFVMNEINSKHFKNTNNALYTIMNLGDNIDSNI